MAGNAIETLATVNQTVSLGLQLGNILIPVVAGMITSARKLEEDQGTVEYQVVIKMGRAELDAATEKFGAVLQLAQAELERLKAAGGGLKEPGQ